MTQALSHLRPADIRLYGRSDLSSFFHTSGLWDHDEWPHNPVVAFVMDDPGQGGQPPRPRVLVIDNARDLAALDDATPCMRQWPGKYRSDFFKFTVRQARRFLPGGERRPTEALHVVEDNA